MTKRWLAVIFLALGLFGIGALAAWNIWTIHESAMRSHEQWVRRLSGKIVTERQSLARWVEQFPDGPSLVNRMARSNPAVNAIFLTDHTAHETKRWARPSVSAPLESADPRLIVLELNLLRTEKAQKGPVLFVDGVAHETIVRPLEDNRTLIVYIKNPVLTQIFQEEKPVGPLDTFVYDNEEHPIFLSKTPGPMDPMIQTAIDKARAGVASGEVYGRQKQAWRWFATFHTDSDTDWIYVVSEPLVWAYAPFFPFLISLLGVFLLASLAYRSSATLHQQSLTRELRQFAQRLDKFIFSRPSTLEDPPGSLKELAPVVKNLRWLVPEWEKAEALARELDLDRKLLSSLIESLPEGILFFSAEGALQLSNELGRAFLTLEQEEGREYKVVNDVKVPQGFLQPFLEPVFTGRQKNFGKEVETTWADNKYLYRLWVESVESKDETIEGFFVVIRDITFRRQWERVQEQLLSGITHDLRGPLSAVMGYLDLMRRQVRADQQPKVAEYLQLARDAAVRLTRMVSDILDVVRFEQGNIDLAPQAIPMREIFERLDTLFSVMAQQKQVQLKFDVDEVLKESAWGDPKLLERVFDNLVGNAIKFTPSGGAITVAARRGPERLIFEVIDTGRGIPREAQSRIFDKFQQVRPGDRSAGYGLGLAVAKFIVEAHKGEIRVESEIGHGSRFTFWIPDAPPQNPSPDEISFA